MMVRTSIALMLSALSCKATPSLDTIKHNLIKWEGYKLIPYRDPVSRDWCVGIGHNLTIHRHPIKRAYTQMDVERLFLRDIAEAVDACRAAIRGYDELPDPIQLVCLNLAFTCGRSGLMHFTQLRRALSLRSYGVAVKELRLSRWYSQVSPSRARWACDVLYNQP